MFQIHLSNIHLCGPYFCFALSTRTKITKRKDKYRATLYYEMVRYYLATNQSKFFYWMISIFMSKYSVITSTYWFCNFTAIEMHQWFSLIWNIFLLCTTLLKKLKDIANDSEININVYLRIYIYNKILST